MSETRADARRGGWRAWAELLRAPLLLSPIADVLAGASAGFAALRWIDPSSTSSLDGALPEAALRSVLAGLPCAAGAGVCLLAAGMAQNALADQADDRVHKPTRPLPRGALTAATVWRAWAALTVGGVLLAACAGTHALALATGIVVLTAAYHYMLKASRVPGCVALGALRGMDLLLGFTLVEAWHAGAVATTAEARDLALLPVLLPSVALWFAGLYAVFMTGASLHASTDDQPSSPSTRLASRTGLALQVLSLAMLIALGLSQRAGIWSTPLDGVLFVAQVGLPFWAELRVLTAWSRLPPGPLTGVMLSGLYLFDAGICCTHELPAAGIASACVVLVLFISSRLMRRAFPPT